MEEQLLTINGIQLTARPLSFWELMTLFPNAMNKILIAMDKGLTQETILVHCSREILNIINHVSGKSDDFWKSCPADEGFLFMCKVLNMTITENFIKALSTLEEGLKQISQVIGQK